MQEWNLFDCRTLQSFYLVFCCKASIFNTTFLFQRGHILGAWCHICFSHQLFRQVSWTNHTQLEAADQPHFCYSNILFTFLLNVQMGQRQQWTTAYRKVFFTSDRPSFDCLACLECVLAVDSFSVSEDIITLSWQPAFVCICVFNGWCLYTVGCHIGL